MDISNRDGNLLREGEIWGAPVYCLAGLWKPEGAEFGKPVGWGDGADSLRETTAARVPEENAREGRASQRETPEVCKQFVFLQSSLEALISRSMCRNPAKPGKDPPENIAETVLRTHTGIGTVLVSPAKLEKPDSWDGCSKHVLLVLWKNQAQSKHCSSST